MAITEREKHISRLDAMAKCLEDCIDPTVECGDCDSCDLNYAKGNMGEMLETIKYAISSIRTDLFYDLVEEKIDFYTKDEAVAMLTELQTEIEELPMIDCCDYAIDNCIDRVKVENLILEKIDKLKENNDD